MIHETTSTGEACSSSISQTFAVPIAAAYYRAFWPRFSLIHEDVGQCGHIVKDMVVLGSGTEVGAVETEGAKAAARQFSARIDVDNDGTISPAEMQSANNAGERTIEELISFHDVDGNGIVTAQEVEDSWVMYASAQYRLNKRGQRGEL